MRTLNANPFRSVPDARLHRCRTQRDAQSFAAQRPGADPGYVYSQITPDRVTRLPHEFTLNSNFTVQVSNGALLGTEQLGVGGFNSVRGYGERAEMGTAEF